MRSAFAQQLILGWASRKHHITLLNIKSGSYELMGGKSLTPCILIILLFNVSPLHW